MTQKHSNDSAKRRRQKKKLILNKHSWLPCWCCTSSLTWDSCSILTFLGELYKNGVPDLKSLIKCIVWGRLKCPDAHFTNGYVCSVNDKCSIKSCCKTNITYDASIYFSIKKGSMVKKKKNLKKNHFVSLSDQQWHIDNQLAVTFIRFKVYHVTFE